MPWPPAPARTTSRSSCENASPICATGWPNCRPVSSLTSQCSTTSGLTTLADPRSLPSSGRTGAKSRRWRSTVRRPQLLHRPQAEPAVRPPAAVVTPAAAAPAPAAAPRIIEAPLADPQGANALIAAGLPTPIPPPAEPPSNGGQFAAQAAQPVPSPRPPAPDVEQPFRPRRPNTDEHDARLAHAFEAAQDLLFLQTPLEGMEFVIRLLTELIPTEAASGCLYDIDTDELRFVTVAGPGGDGRQGVAIPRRSGLMGVATTHEGLALRVDELSDDPRFRAAIDGRDGVAARNALYLALSHQGRLLGVIQLLNRENRNAFTESDANLLSYVGRQAAAFLHKARIAPQARSGH